MKNRLHFLPLLFLFLMVGNLIGQQKDNKGTEFWICFEKNLSIADSRTLFITGDVATNGTVDIPGLAFTVNFSVVPDSITSINIPLTADVLANNGIENKGIHITANDEVTVYGLNQRSASTDAFLALPVDILGTDHYLMAYRGDGRSFSLYSQFAVVGTEDNTILTITPSLSARGQVAGVPYQVTLNEGEVYQLRGDDRPDDVTGTRIQSDKPVAVFSGAECTNIKNNLNACDHLIEQIPPKSTLGRRFVAIPLATRLNGDTYRFGATEDSTEIRVNGVLETTLSAGQFFEKIYATSIEIVSTKPIIVAQFSNSSSYDGITSDPFMMLIPPFEQYLGNYTLSTPASGFVGHYLNIIAPQGGIASVELDGSFIPSSDFAQIGTSNFFGATKLVSAGTHTVKSTFPVGVHSYGFGTFDSYGYPGGQSLSEVASADSLQLTLATGIAPQGDTVCVAEATVLDSLNQPLPGIRVDFDLKGANAMTGFAFTDSMGVATFCYLAANAGFDTVTASTGGLSATGVVQILPCALSLSETHVNILNAIPGSINLTVTGNVAAATYKWTGPNGFMANTQDISGLADSGTYKVVVTDPFFANCKDSLEIKITASTTPCALGLSTTQIKIINGNPGSVDLTVIGAMGALTYSWTGPNAYTASTQDISGLTDSGTYKVVVTDLGAPNCKDSITVKIEEVTVGVGNCDLTCLSDGSWMKSTVVTPTNLSGLWMGVNGALPGAGTFTDPVMVGQPFPWAHVTPVGGADPITTGHSITYFRKTFNLTTTAGIEARFRMNVDDQAEIYVNGTLIARIEGMGRANYRNPHHDARFYGAGSVDNGFMGGDAYDFTTGTAMSSIFQVGANELVVVVRNLGKVNDKGGFSMRMDLSGCGIVPKSTEVVNTPAVQSAFEVYPNPTNGNFAVYIPRFNSEAGAQVRLYDLNGRMLLQDKAETEVLEMNIAELPAGVYYIKVNHQGVTHTQKVVKQ